jgi:hypothetical protein
MRSASDKVVEKIKPRILPSIYFFFKRRAVSEITWKNTVVPEKTQTGIQHMRFACWVTKATYMVLGVVGSIILSVTDGGGGFGGDSSCGAGSSGGSSYVLLPLLILGCVLTACS